MARHKQAAEKAPRGLRRVHVVLVLVAVVGLGLIAWLWMNMQRSQSEFRQLVELGQPALSHVQSFPAEGLGQHVAEGARVFFSTDPPTSGAHYPTPTAPGYYEKPQPPGNLVHALEHGNVVIYYERPPSDVLQKLESWADRFRDHWAGVVVTPLPGLGEQIVLTAWGRELRLGKFDAPSAAAFIDRFRGRGPENPVR